MNILNNLFMFHAFKVTAHAYGTYRYDMLIRMHSVDIMLFDTTFKYDTNFKIVFSVNLFT